MADNTIRMEINGVEHSISEDDLTLGEVEFLEDKMDAPIEDIDFGRAKALRALVFLVVKRSEPQFTWDDAGDISISAIKEPAEPEKPVARKRPTKAASTSG